MLFWIRERFTDLKVSLAISYFPPKNRNNLDAPGKGAGFRRDFREIVPAQVCRQVTSSGKDPLYKFLRGTLKIYAASHVSLGPHSSNSPPPLQASENSDQHSRS